MVVVVVGSQFDLGLPAERGGYGEVIDRGVVRCDRLLNRLVSVVGQRLEAFDLAPDYDEFGGHGIAVLLGPEPRCGGFVASDDGGRFPRDAVLDQFRPSPFVFESFVFESFVFGVRALRGGGGLTRTDRRGRSQGRNQVEVTLRHIRSGCRD